VDTQKLEENLKAMLDGEKKRRKIAIQWLDRLESILMEAGPALWGSGDGGDYVDNAKYVEREKEGKKTRVDIYFRYGHHEGERKTEGTGWYYDRPLYPTIKDINRGERKTEGTGWYYDLSRGYQACWGRLLSDLRGTEFWWAIRAIIEWIPIVISQIDKKSQSRQKLVEMMADPQAAVKAAKRG
jgi:hypothetical protein